MAGPLSQWIPVVPRGQRQVYPFGRGMQVEPWAHRGGGLCSASHTDTVSEQSAPFHPNGHWQLRTQPHIVGLSDTPTPPPPSKGGMRTGLVQGEKNAFPLTTRMSRSPRTCPHDRSGRGGTGRRRTGPRCDRRMDVPALGTLRLSSRRTSRQKCTLGEEEQSFRVIGRRSGRRHGGLSEGGNVILYMEDQTLINSVYPRCCFFSEAAVHALLNPHVSFLSIMQPLPRVCFVFLLS